MPGYNGSGPVGEGPMSGRRRGYCTGAYGAGPGAGMGWNRGAGRGMGRGFRFRNTLPSEPQPFDMAGVDEEKRMLHAQVADLKSRLSLLEQRLANLAEAPEAPTAES